MRVRILRRPAGVLDGVPLSAFVPGLSYDVNASLGYYLVSQRLAEELLDTGPVLIVPMAAPYDLEPLLDGGIHIVRSERDTSEDRPPRRPRKRRR